MHTALRLGVHVATRLRKINPDLPYLLLRSLRLTETLHTCSKHHADFVIGGEYETLLIELVDSIADETYIEIEGVLTTRGCRITSREFPIQTCPKTVTG